MTIRPLRELTFILALSTGLSISSAGAQVVDTIRPRTPFFTGRDGALAGAFTAAAIAVAPFDERIAASLQRPSIQQNGFLKNAATGFRLLGSPGSLVAGAGLYLVGKADHQTRVADLGLHSVESMLIADVVGAGIKAVAGRARPYMDVHNSTDFRLGRGFKSDDYRSFPSGHTINGFAFAATVSRETQIWWPHSRWLMGSVMYGGATLVGLSRMYNNQHWASDVVGGAAIGTIIGLKVVKFNHSHPGNSIDRALLSVNYNPGPRGARRFSLSW